LQVPHVPLLQIQRKQTNDAKVMSKKHLLEVKGTKNRTSVSCNHLHAKIHEWNEDEIVPQSNSRT